MTYPIIGVGGVYGAGKDEIADHLVRKHGWVKQGMSDTLLRYTLELNIWIRLDKKISFRSPGYSEVIWAYSPGEFIKAADLITGVGYTEAKKQQEFRDWLQKFGTEVGRDIDEDLWVNIARRRALAAAEEAPVVLTGIRFPNEVAMMRAIGALIYVVRDTGATGKTALHPSETSVSSTDFDIVIENNGTLEELYAQVDDLVSEDLW